MITWIRIQIVQFLRVILSIGIAFAVLLAVAIMFLVGFIQPEGE